MTHKYTAAQRKRIRGMIDAFNGARVNLIPCAGICFAIREWEQGGNDRFQQADDAIALITRCLQGHIYLEGFVCRGSGHPSFNPHAIAWRQAWLDQLIADCKDALK